MTGKVKTADACGAQIDLGEDIIMATCALRKSSAIAWKMPATCSMTGDSGWWSMWIVATRNIQLSIRQKDTADEQCAIQPGASSRAVRAPLTTQPGRPAAPTMDNSEKQKSPERLGGYGGATKCAHRFLLKHFVGDLDPILVEDCLPPASACAHRTMGMPNSPSRHCSTPSARPLVRGHRIEVRGFGSFSVNHRPPRMGRNPLQRRGLPPFPPSASPFQTGQGPARSRGQAHGGAGKLCG